MILTNRLFTRRPPERDAKSIYIFCEGKKREYLYFLFFKEIDSRINIEIYPLQSDENNSPTGLFAIAGKCLIKSENNPDPKYELLDEDEVWFVIDTDKWGDKIPELRKYCNPHRNWKIAQSNPCFEVWLYYHFFDAKADFDWMDSCKEWKAYLSAQIPGGFNSKKHPIFIDRAITNSKNLFEESEGAPLVGSTGVFRLAEVIYSVCRWKIENILNKI